MTQLPNINVNEIVDIFYYVSLPTDVRIVNQN